MRNTTEIAISAIQDCLADQLSPVLLAEAYADLREECNRQLEICMNCMTDEQDGGAE